jgi:hydroxylamine dehydrogenase
MKRIKCLSMIGLFLWMSAVAMAAEVPVSDATGECLGCHSVVHPGIVESWKKSRHGKITTKTAMMVKGRESKVSSFR